MRISILISFLFFSFRVFSQFETQTPTVIGLDSFKGKFSRVDMKRYPLNDTLTLEEKNIPDEILTVAFTPSGKKSCVRYAYKNNEDGSIDTFYYGKNGKLKEEYDLSNLGEGEDHFYRADGKEIRTVHFVPECDAGYDVLKYDRKGNLIRLNQVGMYSNSTVMYFHYDKSGRMFMMENDYHIDLGNGDVLRKDSVYKTFDSNGNLTDQKGFTVDYSKAIRGKYPERTIKMDYETTYAYNESGKIATIATVDSTEQTKRINQYKFSTDGLLLSELDIDMKREGSDTLVDSSLVTFTYDSHQFMKTQTVKTGQRTFASSYAVEYNSDGNPVSCVEYLDDRKTALYKWEYSK